MNFSSSYQPSRRRLIGLSDLLVTATSGIRRWLTLSAVGAVVVGIVLARLAIGEARWHRLIGTVPVVGPLWHWSGAAAFARLLAVLLDNRLPLSRALGLAADGLRNRALQCDCRFFSRGVESGARLSELLLDSQQLPRSLVPFVEYGERRGDLPDAFASGQRRLP